jgi:hypothetical protein
VYLDAFVPADGQCLLDFIPAERLAELRQRIHERGAGWLIPPPSAAFFKVNEADQAWVDGKTVPHPLACFEQRIRLTGALNKVAGRLYIRAAGYPSAAYDTIAERLRADSAWGAHGSVRSRRYDRHAGCAREAFDGSGVRVASWLSLDGPPEDERSGAANAGTANPVYSGSGMTSRNRPLPVAYVARRSLHESVRSLRDT